jgi:CcmD family protein
MKTFSMRARAALATFLCVVAFPALALAQEFVKISGKEADDVPAGPFVGIAYGFIWIAILAYVVSVARGLNRVRGELDDLRRKLDGVSGKQ